MSSINSKAAGAKEMSCHFSWALCMDKDSKVYAKVKEGDAGISFSCNYCTPYMYSFCSTVAL